MKSITLLIFTLLIFANIKGFSQTQAYSDCTAAAEVSLNDAANNGEIDLFFAGVSCGGAEALYDIADLFSMAHGAEEMDSNELGAAMDDLMGQDDAFDDCESDAYDSYDGQLDDAAAQFEYAISICQQLYGG